MIKSLLALSDEALELADRYDIEEFKLALRYRDCAEYHAEIVRQIIDFNLSAKQIKEMCEGGEWTIARTMKGKTFRRLQ